MNRTGSERGGEIDVAVPGVAPDSGARVQAVTAERLRILGRNSPPILFVHLVLATIMWLVNRAHVPAPLCDAWMIAMGVMVGVRLFALRREPVDVAPSAAALRRSARRFVLGSLWAGLLWGATAVLFYWHGALEQQFLLVVALTGMGAGAVTSLIMYMPAFYAYVLPSLLPLAVVSLLLGDLPHAALGIATLVYAFALGYFGRNFSAALVESLALRYENLDLVEELRAQKRQADEANAAKSRFLAAASHDLRQPVHALALFSTTLAARRLEPGTRHLVSQIGAAVESLERMFDALLDISRLDAGVLRVRMEAFDLGTLVAELRAEFTPLAATKGLAFDAMEGACWVHADTALVERILRNLLSNAVRYTDSGTVTLRWHAEGERVRVEVADTGRGIAADEHAAIFDEFHQLPDDAGRHRGGLGLGLTIVKRAAKLLGTHIELHSAPGRGSVFALDLERAAPVAATAPVSARAMQSLVALAALPVLVLDDDPGILRGMHTLLSDWQCAPTCCDSHEQVLEALAAGLRPGAVIADFRLGGEYTGYDTIRAVRATLGTPVPALIVTGDIVSAELRRAEAEGIPVLHKPAAPAKLRSFLRAAQRQAG